MIAPKQIQKPENWQDFEKLCKKLWGEVWNCPNLVKRNGRAGQNQCGVDVYGLPKGEAGYFGIQCKGKDDYSKSKLTVAEIECEIAKAKDFKPKLAMLIFATTADKDVKIEQFIREKNLEHIDQQMFNIDIFSWADIVDLLEEHRTTFNWYVNNCQYKDSSDVRVFFEETETFIIHPKYIRTTTKFVQKPASDPYEHFFSPKDYQQIHAVNIFNPLYKKTRVDYRWCNFPITLKNVGSTVIEDYKLTFLFESSKIDDIDDRFRYFDSSPFLDQGRIAIENAQREQRRELFESSEYRNVIDFKPIRPVLVQSDSRNFTLGVKPKDGVQDINIEWLLRSRDYEKKGILLLKVFPEYEEVDKTVQVEFDKLRDDEISIEPKIVITN